MKKETLTRWTAEKSCELYGVRNWGSGYFDVSEKGNVLLRPFGAQASTEVSLMDIVAGLNDRGLKMPVLIRFANVLADRIRQLNESFQKAMREAEYKGTYRGVYPIKVNQQQQVIEEISRYGKPYHHGLECGSKAELIAALAYMQDPDSYVVCNGYKDEEFIDLALYALKMGVQTILVVEMPGEVNLILDRAERMNIRPRLGVRAKLSTRVEGHWTESGGDLSMFGLNASHVIDIVDLLRGREMLDCLHMLHFHLGSQVPNIRNIRAAVAEGSRFYVNLVNEGAKMGILNVGGGLAIDYDGSHTNSASSSNYNLDEYAADVVEVVMLMANQAGVPHPTIVSESGRATVAHHSVLLFNILDVSQFESHGLPASLPEDASDPLKNLMHANQSLTAKNVQECYHDAVYYRDEIRSAFEHGTVTLRERALAERIFWHVVNRVAGELEGRKYVPDEMEGLRSAVADVYHGNFSVFQSLPDSWAIEQLFPVMPIHRLNERPSRQATVADITCDCDGKLNRFIDLHDVKRTLPVHPPGDGEYYMGVFLIGAYQETLGDLHNLLGDTHVVNVNIDPNGLIEYEREIPGDTVADVLSYVEYNPSDLRDRMRRHAEASVRAGRISPQERREIVAAYEKGLRGYTYFAS